MFHVIFAFLLGIFSPSQSDKCSHNNDGQVTTMGDPSGETGTIPPRPPRP